VGTDLPGSQRSVIIRLRNYCADEFRLIGSNF
jgi:hypothetical protein